MVSTITENLPDFMVRVKLPSENAYPSCPSGDTDYEIAYDKAVKKATPAGFEVIEERLGVANPKDSSGYTYLRLRCVDKQLDLGNLFAEVERLRKKIGRLQGVLQTGEEGE